MIENKLKKGLGRGLSSLIGDNSKKALTNKIQIQDVFRNKFQPRKYFNKQELEDLSSSIKERGVIQPIIVRPSKSSEHKYELIAGERRWLASQNAGLNEIPAVILDIDDAQSLEFAIVENVQRQDLNPIEESRGYQKLIENFNYDNDKLSKFVGKSRSYIVNSLRLLSLPKEVLLMVEETKLSVGHARSLIGLDNAIFVAQKIIKEKLSVRQTELLVKKFKNKSFTVVKRKDANILNLQKDLEEKTGLVVSINNKKNNSGMVSFEYKDLDQLQRLIGIIKSNY
ncbi:MAG: chromosome partitioning protein ParB [Candidatus Pelagibacter sp. TMED64]|nr:chromosome partitioning protein ParB [Candidatus Pelagibacter sp.]OUU65528.1 MAG: chromosome partitioning protein ParB [Candidatus Pelagibacter sp. TMED64]|tara:strand:- start:9405 stop:10253 length:849 start_codon:yes stop_codon:yes gene_type:complete